MNGRNAATPEPPPVGHGEIVLHDALRRIDEQIATARALGNDSDAENLSYVAQDLRTRAEMGIAKYQTYLRTRNGRNGKVDLYQEVLDTVMYSCLLRMEGDTDASRFLETFINAARVLAEILQGVNNES